VVVLPQEEYLTPLGMPKVFVDFVSSIVTERMVPQKLVQASFEGIECELLRHSLSAEETLSALTALGEILRDVTPYLALEEAALKAELFQTRASFRTMWGGNRKQTADIKRRLEVVGDLYLLRDKAIDHLQRSEQVKKSPFHS
jgi:hypothetical protein